MVKKLSTEKIALIVVAVILFLSIVWFISAYNRLVSMDEDVNGKWAQVETVYQRRADLIPNLVATVEGAADYEGGTQTKIAELRTAATAAKSEWDDANTIDQKVVAANKLDGVAAGLAGLNINVERYPDLKVPANFQSLQDELSNTENKIAVERKRYNDAVKIFNAKVRRFPTNFVAGMFGFEQRIYYEADEAAEEAPNVEF